MGASYAAQASGVALVTFAWAIVLVSAMWRFREKLAAVTDPLALPTLCLACSTVFLVVTATLVKSYGEPGVPLVNSFSNSWFNAGWKGNLVFMGVRIDSPVAYGLIINYQITRCVLGSLLSNAFQPYVSALQSKLLSEELKRKTPLLVARTFTDIYGFVSGLTDLILYVSQVDIFIVSGVATIITNYLCTWLLLETAGPKRYKKDAETLAKDMEKTHPQPLLIGTYNAQLRL
jgi:hypothetical protein